MVTKSNVYRHVMEHHNIECETWEATQKEIAALNDAKEITVKRSEYLASADEGGDGNWHTYWVIEAKVSRSDE